jgi:hypothetical protein
MPVLDIILIALFVVGAYHGYKKGLILEIISITAFILAIVGVSSSCTPEWNTCRCYMMVSAVCCLLWHSW